MTSILFKNLNKVNREKLFNHNLALVVSIATRYFYFSGQVKPLIDYIQSGSIGLWKAIDKFDIKKGNKFSTYAYIVIRNEILISIGKQWDKNDIGEWLDNRNHNLLMKVEDALTIEKEIFYKELKEILNELCPQQKHIIELYFFEEISLQDIGDMMGISKQAVEQKKKKAIQILKDIIKDRDM